MHVKCDAELGFGPGSYCENLVELIDGGFFSCAADSNACHDGNASSGERTYLIPQRHGIQTKVTVDRNTDDLVGSDAERTNDLFPRIVGS